MCYWLKQQSDNAADYKNRSQALSDQRLVTIVAHDHPSPPPIIRRENVPLIGAISPAMDMGS
jgi:hypothetical protein